MKKSILMAFVALSASFPAIADENQAPLSHDLKLVVLKEFPMRDHANEQNTIFQDGKAITVKEADFTRPSCSLTALVYGKGHVELPVLQSIPSKTVFEFRDEPWMGSQFVVNNDGRYFRFSCSIPAQNGMGRRATRAEVQKILGDLILITDGNDYSVSNARVVAILMDTLSKLDANDSRRAEVIQSIERVRKVLDESSATQNQTSESKQGKAE